MENRLDQQKLINPLVRSKSDGITLLHHFAKLDGCANMLEYLVKRAFPSMLPTMVVSRRCMKLREKECSQTARRLWLSKQHRT